jgi:hypothetical protein
MGFTKACGRNPAIRLRSSGQTILVCAIALLPCLIGLAGCGSSPGSQQSNVASGSGSPSSSCSGSSFVRGDHKSPSTSLPVLVSAQTASVDTPPPDVNLHEDGDPDDSVQEANTLATDGNTALDSPGNEPFQSLVQDNQADIDQEATGAGLTEEVKLLTDEGVSGLDASDFGQEVCNAVSAIKGSLGSLENTAQIYAILKQQDTTGSNDVMNVLENGVQLFTQALGQCFDTLSVAEQIADDIEDLYC